jgi:hypothetical protein
MIAITIIATGITMITAAVATKYDLLPELIETSKIVRDTKLAQNASAVIVMPRLFLLSIAPHNLKVVGSNPTPATKLRRPVNGLCQ